MLIQITEPPTQELQPTFYLGGQAYVVSPALPPELGDRVVEETVTQYMRLQALHAAGEVVPEEGRRLTDNEWRLIAAELALGLSVLATQLGPFLPVTRRLLRSVGVLVGGPLGMMVMFDVD